MGFLYTTILKSGDYLLTRRAKRFFSLIYPKNRKSKSLSPQLSMTVAGFCANTLPARIPDEVFASKKAFVKGKLPQFISTGVRKDNQTKLPLPDRFSSYV